MLVALSATNSRGDWFDSFIKYECVPEIGYFKISDEGVRGRENVENLDNLREQLAERGIYSGQYEGAPQVYHKTESLGSHKVDTTITIFAPARVGYGGANWTTTVDISIDGVDKVSSHIGYYAPLGQTIDYITIYTEYDEIRIGGSRGDDEISMVVNLSDATLITDDSFIPEKVASPEHTASDTPEDETASTKSSDEMLEHMIEDMKGQIMEYLDTVGTASVADIWENTFGIDSAIYVALFALRKEGKVSWPGGEDEGLSLAVIVSLVESASDRA